MTQDIKYKKSKRVITELRIAKWSNDTLSPLSIKRYWELASRLIPEDEKCKTALMAKSFASSLSPKYFLLIATENNIYMASSTGERRLSNRNFDFSNFKYINLKQDLKLKSRIYIKIKVSWWKTVFLETADPTSAIHFKKYIDKINKIETERQKNALNA
ncbi:hypothetical protein CXP39_00220 [Mesoplasma syrphidae]|uniref:YokE-like PH domain-containing protein n=1 Tax=Mesoplasma syrphidae TaxID=225999 RepID=A0A2K9C8A4_9MOLU|nr:hypothetical protein [Mesoplasma syrphidae]AUF83235.1 hypothetical protein CXP39_00220 [Mesoplasma syrphidae]